MSDSDNTIPDGFRVIPGYPRYAINEHGTVLSICPRNGRGKDRPWKNASQMTFIPDKDGYHCINLYRDGRLQQIRVHALVLTVFVGPCPDGLQCRHLDGNKTNNCVSNLSWGTPLENGYDKILHGTSNLGEKNTKAKLTEKDVLEIRERASKGETQTAIAKDFPMTIKGISLIVNRRTWKHI